MDLHIVVVDDLDSDRDKLMRGIRTFFSRAKDWNVSLEEYDRAEALLDVFEAGHCDVAMLDIQLGGMNGIDLARRLRLVDPRLLIVFLTTSREYAFDAFPIHPFDYLVKPYRDERLAVLLSEIVRALSTEEPTLEIRVPRGVQEVPLGKIVAVESRGHSVELHLRDGQSVRSIMRFAEIADLVADDERFLTCNRGVIVNMDQVLKLEQGAFKMRDGTLYPMRVRDRSALVARFSQYMISRVEKGTSA